MPNDDLQLALARLEGKVDSIIVSQGQMRTSVSDIDARVRQLEQDVAKLSAPKQPWPAIVSAAVAALAVLLVIAEQLYTK